MGALKLLIGAALLVAAEAVAADPVERWRPHIDEASQRFGIPVTWIERVMRAESGGRAELGGRPIVSRAGAMGLMQLMPATWAAMRHRLGLGSDPHAPRDNILAGTFYLRLMYDRFGYPGLFGAYNAGPGRYSDWIEGRRSLPVETRAYLASVTRDLAGTAQETLHPRPLPQTSPQALFFAVGTRSAEDHAPLHGRLFVIAPSPIPFHE